MCKRVRAHWMEQRVSNFLVRDETQHRLQPAFAARRQLLKSAYGRLPLPELHCSRRGGGGRGGDWEGTHLEMAHPLRWIWSPQRQPGASYLYDVMRVLFGPLPAAQLHPSVQRAEAGARLCAEQVVLREEVMGGPQGYFSWDKGVHVPVNRHAVNVASRVDVVQHLGERGWRETLSVSSN